MSFLIHDSSAKCHRPQVPECGPFKVLGIFDDRTLSIIQRRQVLVRRLSGRNDDLSRTQVGSILTFGVCGYRTLERTDLLLFEEHHSGTSDRFAALGVDNATATRDHVWE